MQKKTDGQGNCQHYYINDSDFMLNYVPYEQDAVSGRYYFLEASISMTGKTGREGGLVRRRVSKAAYETALAECRTRLAESVEQSAQHHSTLQQNTPAAQLQYVADRAAGKVLTAGAAFPRISADDMLEDFEAEMRMQISSPHYHVNRETAVHELYGFRKALQSLELLGDCLAPLRIDHFADIPEAMPPIRRNKFAHLMKFESNIAGPVWRLGEVLEEECPDNDCRLYLNIFRMAKELDTQLDGLTGYTADVVRGELNKRYFELVHMYIGNYAVRQYRKRHCFDLYIEKETTA